MDFAHELDVAKKTLDLTSTYVECMLKIQTDYEPTEDTIKQFMEATQKEICGFCDNLRQLIRVLQIEAFEEEQCRKEKT